MISCRRASLRAIRRARSSVGFSCNQISRNTNNGSTKMTYLHGARLAKLFKVKMYFITLRLQLIYLGTESVDVDFGTSCSSTLTRSSRARVICRIKVKIFIETRRTAFSRVRRLLAFLRVPRTLRATLGANNLRTWLAWSDLQLLVITQSVALANNPRIVIEAGIFAGGYFQPRVRMILIGTYLTASAAVAKVKSPFLSFDSPAALGTGLRRGSMSSAPRSDAKMAIRSTIVKEGDPLTLMTVEELEVSPWFVAHRKLLGFILPSATFGIIQSLAVCQPVRDELLLVTWSEISTSYTYTTS